jgi:hypothetical protein
VTAPAERYCPHCGVAYEDGQEYCLECGARLPVNRGVVGVLAQAWQRRLSWYPGDWIWPVLLFAVLAALATATALAAKSARDATRPYVATGDRVPLALGTRPQVVPVTSAPATLPAVTNQPTVTTGPLPNAPGSASNPRATTPTPKTKTNPNALAVWPANKSGYTLVLESLPAANGRAAALARARLAKQNGIKEVGVLTSGEYASLHAGYYVVFAGIYGSASEASAALSAARAHGFPDAFEREITR